MNPADYQEKLAKIPQTHIAGGADKTVSLTAEVYDQYRVIWTSTPTGWSIQDKQGYNMSEYLHNPSINIFLKRQKYNFYSYAALSMPNTVLFLLYLYLIVSF